MIFGQVQDLPKEKLITIIKDLSLKANELIFGEDLTQKLIEKAKNSNEKEKIFMKAEDPDIQKKVIETLDAGRYRVNSKKLPPDLRMLEKIFDLPRYEPADDSI